MLDIFLLFIKKKYDFFLNLKSLSLSSLRSKWNIIDTKTKIEKQKTLNRIKRLRQKEILLTFYLFSV